MALLSFVVVYYSVVFFVDKDLRLILECVIKCLILVSLVNDSIFFFLMLKVMHVLYGSLALIDTEDIWRPW